MRRLLYFVFFGFFMFSAAAFTAAEGEKGQTIDSSELELEKEIKGLKKELSEIRKELKGLKILIKSRLPLGPPPQRGNPNPITARTVIKDDPFMGSNDAPLVMVEFSDYQCPFCGRFYKNTLPRIKKDYIETGKVKYVFKDFPLTFHKQAPKAAEAAHCAGEDGKYWEMHDLIFVFQKQQDVPDLINHAKKLGLDSKSFEKCLNDGRYSAGIKKDIEAGMASGVTGTPSFLLGKLNGNGEVEGSVIRGARPYKTFKAAIEAKLKK